MMTDQERTRNTTGQVFGMALMTAVMVIVVILSFLLLGGEDVATFVVATVLMLAGTFFVWRFDRLWARIVGMVVTLAVLSFTFWFAFGVLQPFSPLEFITGLGYLIGILFALIGGFAGLFRRDGANRKRLQSGALALIGVLSVVSIAGFVSTRSSVSEEDAAGATVLEMVNFEFAPGLTTVATGDKLLLTNSDPFAHDLTLDDPELYVYLGPGGETLVDLSSVPAGTYEYWCSLHTFEEDGVKEGMVGTITIES